jgi:hypothetical protein
MAREEAAEFSFVMTVPDLDNDIDVLVEIFEDGDDAEVKKTAPKRGANILASKSQSYLLQS